MVTSGKRREFRVTQGNALKLANYSLFPSLCVCYRKRKAAGDYDSKLMVLEGMREERLIEASEESLRLAGYEGANRDEMFARFRREWMLREKRRFEPARRVMVFTVRPLMEDELPDLAMGLLRHLYGGWLRDDL